MVQRELRVYNSQKALSQPLAAAVVLKPIVNNRVEINMRAHIGVDIPTADRTGIKYTVHKTITIRIYTRVSPVALSTKLRLFISTFLLPALRITNRGHRYLPPPDLR